MHLLRRALESHDEHGVLIQASKAIEATSAHLKEHWPGILGGVLKLSGTGSVKALNKLRANRAALATDFAFDESNPRAIEWIRKNTATLIDGLSATTANDIRELVEDAFDGDFDTDDLADQIFDLIGDAVRAETIARTEVMRASNQGQLEAWDQATEKGLLTGNEKIEWIVTPDDRLCPICEPLDEQTIERGGTFDVDGDQITAPPAHPRCRCTIGLSF